MNKVICDSFRACKEGHNCGGTFPAGYDKDEYVKCPINSDQKCIYVEDEDDDRDYM